MEEVNFSNLPNHIAIIMDGNRRWAKKRNLPAKLGHSQGCNALEKIVKYCNKIGIKELTVYAFSTENWKRSKEEVDALMDLLKKYINDFDNKYKEDNIRIKSLGDITKLRDDLRLGIINAQEKTKNNTGLLFNIAINYGGREEIVNAVKNIAKEVEEDKINIEDINESNFSNYLYTHESKDVDLLIRTSGEIRISNFLLWKIAYAEMYFVDVNWPDFDEKELDKAIIEYQKRTRKFGGK